jgi:hypothetical protein
MRMLRTPARRLVVAAGISLLTSACGTTDSGSSTGCAAAAWKEGQEWRVVPQAVIGGSNEVEFGDIVDVALDGDGRIWVADGIRNQIQVFTRDGERVRTIGRKGGGPGEFMMLAGMGLGSIGPAVGRGRPEVLRLGQRGNRWWRVTAGTTKPR